MKRASLLHRDWCHVVDRLGGARAIAASARETKAFQRARGVPGAAVLLRLVLAYCLRQGGLRSTAAWASAIGLADISNVALLNRLRGCGDWLATLIGGLLAAQVPTASRGRLIRLIDATAVPNTTVEFASQVACHCGVVSNGRFWRRLDAGVATMTRPGHVPASGRRAVAGD